MKTDLQKRPDAIKPELVFSLVGDVDQGDFVPWMERQASKLGVGFTVSVQTENNLTLRAVGEPEMTQAFALACSLGPQSVRIDHLWILKGGENL